MVVGAVKIIMTESKRIIFNAAATYGRSLLGLVFGLFSARWVLAALGKSDLGLFSVVGSIILCIQLLNIVMSTAVARYYAYAIGEASNLEPVESAEYLCRWFNSAASLHFLLPVVLILLGYPVGIWAINNWIVVPPDRIQACIWVFRFSLVAAFVNMVSVPYIAMYRAKQLIAELTVWEVIRTVVTFIGAFVLLYVGGDHLIIYSGIMAFSPVVILTIQMWRARCQFGYCRLRLPLLFDKNQLKQIVAFGGCELFSSLGCVVRDNGAAFLINRIFGPVLNSAYSIANQLSSQTNTLALAMNGALMPAIATSEGAGDRDRAIRMANQSCKFCAALVLLFAIPLFLEVDEVLRLWLVHPPECTNALCRCILVTAVLFKLGWGYHMAICAVGRVAFYQFSVGLVSILTLPLIYALVLVCGVVGVGYGLMLNAAILSLMRVFFGVKIIGVRFRLWLHSVLIPVAAVAVLSWGAGNLIVCQFGQSFLRICLTTSVSTISFAAASWLLICNADEREYLISVVKRRVKIQRGSK